MDLVYHQVGQSREVDRISEVERGKLKVLLPKLALEGEQTYLVSLGNGLALQQKQVWGRRLASVEGQTQAAKD